MWIKFVNDTQFNKGGEVIWVENEEVAQATISRGDAFEVDGPNGQEVKREETEARIKAETVKEIKKKKKKK